MTCERAVLLWHLCIPQEQTNSFTPSLSYVVLQYLFGRRKHYLHTKQLKYHREVSVGTALLVRDSVTPFMSTSIDVASHTIMVVLEISQPATYMRTCCRCGSSIQHTLNSPPTYNWHDPTARC